MKIVGIGGLLGIFIGVGIAEWLGNENNAAYYSVVVFGGIVGSVISALLFRNKDNSVD